MTVHSPNYCPVKSIKFFDLAWRKHPQDLVWPFLKLEILTVVILPQSHWHIQVVSFVTFVGPGRKATNLPKRYPVKSNLPNLITSINIQGNGGYINKFCPLLP